MTDLLPEDPIADGLAHFGERLRRGETTVEATTRAYLDRIAALDGLLGAFQHVAADQALAAARAVDALLHAGTDLGPLMGVPVAVKDLFAIRGMPVTAGSSMPVDDLIGEEGRFVAQLRRLGCVILGKTKTVEFALGATGVNSVRGTPRNPWDLQAPRVPGGSSSGSAVAVAAGLAGFAIGSDTGGSVRIPAAFNGLFGLKPTVGLYPVDGVFPLSPTLDSIGPLCRSASDAALVFEATMGRKVHARAPEALRLGRLRGYFEQNLGDEVAIALETTVQRLSAAGVSFIDIEVPEAEERSAIMPVLIAAELMATFGEDRVRTYRFGMDPVTAHRLDRATGLSATEYITALRRHGELSEQAATRFAGLDGWISATVPITAPRVEAVSDLEEAARMTAIINQNTQPGNLLTLCGASLPMPGLALPVGLQLLCPTGSDAEMSGISLALESVLGPGSPPELAAFTG